MMVEQMKGVCWVPELGSGNKSFRPGDVFLFFLSPLFETW